MGILAEIEIGAGKTRDVLTEPSKDKFRETQSVDIECNRIGSWLHRGVIPTKKSREGLSQFLRRVIDSVEQWSFLDRVFVLINDDGTPLK